MKILLTKEEMMNIVSRQTVEEIENGYAGKFKKWDIRETDSGEFTLEYIYDDKGNLKEKFAEDKNGEEVKE